ncbi:hypothetical protein L0668_02485 [Paraglaciecola aquimarina]|uniref:Heparinase II N-terminal domain-containing protein n=1 Tax=Paraglaciecola algarum TaxID=3050085 RepID=A0ABS9D4M2_9ALTE|nr:hypothetical protein [Paraglaciecola sp. G1-23]MCF2946957.1 hypothetical protein [Paraglaciecola sp. G1-23]
MKRREFLTTSALAGSVLLNPFPLAFSARNNDLVTSQHSDYLQLANSLLKTWCDGMLQHQVVDKTKPELHGALWCPACQKIHGRCMDAVYPFMHMAHKTKDKKYLDAAVLSMQWADNVSKDDGSWTVIPDPKSWAGITVFGAIALAETLHYHGEILPPEIKKAWTTRLAEAADYIYKNFDLTFTNINYGATAIYALNLIGRELGEDKYIDRSRHLAKGIKGFFTKPNKFIFGEGKPSQSRSKKGLLPIDLGYNVEETLNGLVMYARHENDTELLTLLSDSMSTHLEFMVPDGCWDNSWGTRHAKWSYWGSRTTDGCQPAFGLMADIKPEFGTAAFLNTELLANCTNDGLLHGGPHYVSHDVLPCIHHTFAHAKPLATMLDTPQALSKITKKTPIPRQQNYGIKHFSELDVWLVAKAGLKATVSSYDSLYKAGNQQIQQATGGAIGLLWHKLSGPLMVASMPKYYMVEVNNQQPQPDGEDIALTPRIETYNAKGEWFTNLYDLEAKVSSNEKNGVSNIDVTAQLKNDYSQTINDKQNPFSLNYEFSDNALKISVQRLSAKTPEEGDTRLTLPLVATSDEGVKQLSEHQIVIIKEKCSVLVSANTPITLRKTKQKRVFNMVPGVEAIIVDAKLPEEINSILTCTVNVIS